MINTAAAVSSNLKRPNPPALDPLSPERVAQALEPMLRKLINSSGAKHSNYSLEVSFHYDSPEEIRVAEMAEDKRSVVVKPNGNLSVTHPYVKEGPTQFQVERNIKQAVELVCLEQKLGWDQLRLRGQGWFQIHLFIGDFRVTGLRTTMNLQVRKQ